MKTDPESLRAALGWAVGSTEKLPPHSMLDEEEFFQAVQDHRLEARLLDRLQSVPGALPAGWVAQLDRSRKLIAQRVRSQAGLYARIAEELARTGGQNDLILLKGFELYAHSGLDRHLRRSGDIDIIGRDPGLVLTAAKTVMGGGAELLRREHTHEYASLWTGLGTPDEQFADIHYRYNITGFPPPLDADRYQPAGKPGSWEVPGRFAIRSITFPEMEEFAVRRRVGDSTVTVLSPELAVIIRCAHMYADYLINASPLPMATVRLDELAAIADLMSLPGFDCARFAAACHRFEAGLVVAFARELAVSLLGRDPFRGLPGSAATGTAPRWFPHSLWWDGIDEGLPVNLGWSTADLVVRSPGYPDITELLGPSVIRADPAGNARATLLAEGDGGVRCIYRLRPGSSLDVAMAFRVRARALDLELSLPPTPHDRMSAVGISSGDWRYEAFYKPGGNHVEFSDYSIPARVGDAATADCRMVDGRHLIRFVAPWPALGRQGPPADGAPLPLLVKVRQQDRNWGPVQMIAVAPLTIQAESSWT